MTECLIQTLFDWDANGLFVNLKLVFSLSLSPLMYKCRASQETWKNNHIDFSSFRIYFRHWHVKSNVHSSI